MFTTREYLTLLPWDALVQIVNDERYLQLDSKATFLKSFTPLNTMDVEVVLSTHRSADEANILPLVDDQTLQYRRLDLTEFFRQTEVMNVSGLPLPISTQAIVRQLGVRNGIAFDLDDFEHFVIESLTDDTYQLVANPYSLRWVGQLTFRLVSVQTQDLGSGQTVEFPTAHRYPNSDTGKIQGWFYLMPYDFTAYRDELRHLGRVPYYLAGDRLATILRQVTGLGWQCTPSAGSLNLCAAVVNGEARYEVEYHGKATPHYTHKSQFENLLILRLNASYCTDVGGSLLLHYN